MICAWKELMAILPLRLRGEIDAMEDEALQEIRLRIKAPPELVCRDKRKWLSAEVNQEDLNFVVNTACKYSPWTATSAAHGYLTAKGGHRIGICGEVILKNGEMSGIRVIHSLCIRIARDYVGIGRKIAGEKGSILILGAPGAGKTTLLRDLIRQIAEYTHVCVVDERMEIFPEGFSAGQGTDVLSGCLKTVGIQMVLRTMGPEYIAVDEITAEEDTRALIKAANCGVRLLATAHAGSLRDYQTRPIYRSLIDHQVFDTIVLLKPDKSYTMERISSWQ